MRILSIDWDYFFPNSENYDWGANEENSIFYEAIWYTRCNSINLATKKDVLSEFRPTIPANFWSIVTNRPMIYVYESHSQIWNYLEEANVYSLDAHHDCGYRDVDLSAYFQSHPQIVKTRKGYEIQETQVSCANWAHFGRITDRINRLELFYPRWRKEFPEFFVNKKPDSISYRLPKPQAYDLIFVCRSGCWTPPWFDSIFIRFLKNSKLETKFLDEVVSKKYRKPSWREAKILQRQMKETLRLFQSESLFSLERKEEKI